MKKNIETLAKNLNMTNQEMLKIIASSLGLSKKNIEEELTLEQEEKIIAYLKEKRISEQSKKTKTLSLHGTSTSSVKVNVLHKRKTSSSERNRNIEQINAQHAREEELAALAKKRKEDEESRKIEKKVELTQKAKPKNSSITPTKDVAEKKIEVPIKTTTSLPRKAIETPKTTAPKKRRGQKFFTPDSSISPAQIKLNEFVRGKNPRERDTAATPLQSSVLKQGFTKPATSKTKKIAIGDSIQVSDLAHKLDTKVATLIKELMKLGFMATINQVIDYETATLVSAELGHAVTQKANEDLEKKVNMGANEYDSNPRPPVVTVMGHVDHGKTSILDYIRRTKVVEGESGGITQHIGAYHVETEKGMISFLDTPGHAAFTAMRARGALLTDIVILVVAADDKVMPQTVEAIQHAKSAEVPIVVALNKIDKPESDPDKVMNELSSYDLVPESWGGDTQYIKVSAITGEGIDTLLEALLLQAEMLELRASNQGPAKGIIIESRLDKNRGPIATVLVQQGMLRKGDQILVGTCFGRIRAQLNEVGNPINEAGPSLPVEILGLDKVPEAGDELVVVTDDKATRELLEARQQEKKNNSITGQNPSMADAFERLESNQKMLNVIVKADTRGSLEAIKHSLVELETEDMKVNLVLVGTGGITEADVSLAHATNSRVVGFHVRANTKVSKQAEKDEVKISYYSVIYELIDDVDNLLHGMLSPLFEEKILGVAEVRDVFDASRFGKVAGCMVTSGFVNRNKPIRVIRDDTVIYEGELESLRRFKEDSDRVRAGTECGIGVKSYKDVRVGDRIENYDKIEIARTKIDRTHQTT